MEAILTYRSLEKTFTDHGFRMFVSLEVPPDAWVKFDPATKGASFGLGTGVRVSSDIPPSDRTSTEKFLKTVSTKALLDELAQRTGSNLESRNQGPDS
jgi:hypothetical protein